jgi:hypothetical protein
MSRIEMFFCDQTTVPMLSLAHSRVERAGISGKKAGKSALQETLYFRLYIS